MGATADSSAVIYPSDTAENSGPMTIAQKTVFVANLKSQSATCAGDASKGFSTNDKVFNVCISLGHPQALNGNWILSLSGYANIEGTDMYLRGHIDLPYTGYQAMQTQFIQALKNMTTVVESNTI